MSALLQVPRRGPREEVNRLEHARTLTSSSLSGRMVGTPSVLMDMTCATAGYLTYRKWIKARFRNRVRVRIRVRGTSHEHEGR